MRSRNASPALNNRSVLASGRCRTIHTPMPPQIANSSPETISWSPSMNQYDAARRPGEIYCVAEWSSMNCSLHYKLQSVKFYFAVTSESPSSVRHGWHVGCYRKIELDGLQFVVQ